MSIATIIKDDERTKNIYFFLLRFHFLCCECKDDDMTEANNGKEHEHIPGFRGWNWRIEEQEGESVSENSIEFGMMMMG